MLSFWEEAPIKLAEKMKSLGLLPGARPNPISQAHAEKTFFK
jgi:hypothetical protein